MSSSVLNVQQQQIKELKILFKKKKKNYSQYYRRRQAIRK